MTFFGRTLSGALNKHDAINVFAIFSLDRAIAFFSHRIEFRLRDHIRRRTITKLGQLAGIVFAITRGLNDINKLRLLC